MMGYTIAWSSLARGAWIETSYVMVNHISSGSSLARGAWIETLIVNCPLTIVKSSLARGAWIETCVEDEERKDKFVVPRERGVD